MIVDVEGRRYASLAHYERKEAMSPRELIEDVIRRLTDGTLTFEVAEDDYTVAAGFWLDGRYYAHGWSKVALMDHPECADAGLKTLMAKPNPSAA